jgi:hypothetical protein
MPKGTFSFSGKNSMFGATQSATRALSGQTSFGRALIGV